MDIRVWIKYLLAVCFFGALTWCAGCGAHTEQDDDQVGKDYISQLNMENNGKAPDVYCFEQGIFYYVWEDDGIPCVYEKSIEDDDGAKKCFTCEEGTPVCMTALSDGSLILIVARVDDDEPKSGSLEFRLLEYDSEGRLTHHSDLEELGRINSPIMIQTVSDGEIMLVHDEGMLLMNREGKISWKKNTADFHIRGISRMKTGEIILMEDRNDTHILHPISNDGTIERQYGSISAFYRVIPSDVGIYAVKDGCICEFDVRGNLKREINVAEQGIDVLCVQGMTEASDGSYLFYVTDGEELNAWGTAVLLAEHGGGNIDVNEKGKIYLAAINPALFSNLIATFNRSSETITVVMKNYSNDAETRVKQIEASLVSRNAPDLFEGYGGISNEYYLNYVSKGVPADISGLIDERDILPRVINDFRVDGCIYGLPTDFYVYTLACPTESINGSTSWNVEEFMDFMERNPNSFLEPDWNIENAKGSVFDMAMQRGLYDFIDFESKKANFDNPKFCDLLQRIQNLKMTQVAQTREERSGAGEAVLWKVYLTSAGDIRQYEWISGEYRDLTLIGFPDGREQSGGLMGYSSILYINSNSSQKEALEKLYQGWLERAKSDRLKQFPIGAEAFERKLEEATEKKYVKDDDGNPVLDDQGNPREDVPIVNGIPIPAMTDEQVTKVREAIDSATYYQRGEWTITGIISEEAGQFFQGKASLDETIDKIQKRVQLYLDELD